MICMRHGGEWGTDETCPNCTNSDGTPKQAPDHGYHPLGKFSSARDDILHYLCTSDWANESSGNTEAPSGYFWRISNKWVDVSSDNGEFNSVLTEWWADNPEVADSWDLRNELVGHFIVQGVDSGMVYVYQYDNEAEMLEAYAALEEVYAAWDTDEDDQPTMGDLYS